jgi:type IV secretory pathway VirD2 relaxase
MSSDDEFEPVLGQMRGQDGNRTARYAGRVKVAAGLAAEMLGRRGSGFTGQRIGRGAGIGRLLGSRDRLAGYRGRRAVVKTRLVRLGTKGSGAARAHLRYIQRDGVTREGTPGELYAADVDRADGNAFLDRCSDDRHQFRFIVSAEDGDQYGDLKPFVRRLMQQVESDLDTRLDWVAVDHFNTGHPHSHIVLRGVDDREKDLVIARDYIAHGLRERAAELATLDLGPRTTREIESRLRHDVEQERLTAIDRRLLVRADVERTVNPRPNDPFFHALETGRLRMLQRMGLAEGTADGRWRLAKGLEQTLRRMGERGDIIRLMQREMTRVRLEARDQRIFSREDKPLVGRVVARGLADELHDRHYLLVDGVDGRGHYVEIGKAEAVEPLPEEAIVRVSARSSDVRASDRTVTGIAAAHGGRYSVALHLAHDPLATQAFAETHVRRLEAMRRAGLDVAREEDGTWRIAADHLAQAGTFEARRLRDKPVEVAVLSSMPLAQLERFDGATWLDRDLAGPSPITAQDGGFGAELRRAMDARRQWLVEQELAVGEGRAFRMQAGALAELQRRELLRTASRLSKDLSKVFVESVPGVRIEGRIVRRIDLASGSVALVERSREFSLVPWQPVLAGQIGRTGSGLMREGGINWRFGRGRSGPEIS